jgi:hypothetical protein
MYIWFVADGQKAYLDSIQNVLQCLDDLRSLLTREKLLREEFTVSRPDINPEEMARRMA